MTTDHGAKVAPTATFVPPPGHPGPTLGPILWHYTCDHHVSGILTDGVVKPLTGQGHPPLAWFTDLDVPHREALGLTSTILSCDRTRHRFRVSGSATVLPYVRIRRDLPARWREALESAEGAMPMHWYVSPEPVPVVYSPGRATYQGDPAHA